MLGGIDLKLDFKAWCSAKLVRDKVLQFDKVNIDKSLLFYILAISLKFQLSYRRNSVVFLFSLFFDIELRTFHFTSLSDVERGMLRSHFQGSFYLVRVGGFLGLCHCENRSWAYLRRSRASSYHNIYP